MTKQEMQAVLSEHLKKFRNWSYAQLAERVERDRGAHDCLETVGGVAPDGTSYWMEFNALWDEKPHGDIRVCGDLCVLPHKPLLGFIPIYVSDVADSFIMSPDGQFVGETEDRLAEPGAARHVGPAAPSNSSDAGKGPPSVSRTF